MGFRIMTRFKQFSDSLFEDTFLYKFRKFNVINRIFLPQAEVVLLKGQYRCFNEYKRKDDSQSFLTDIVSANLKTLPSGSTDGASTFTGTAAADTVPTAFSSDNRGTAPGLYRFTLTEAPLTDMTLLAKGFRPCEKTMSGINIIYACHVQ